jgi:hypothetical protein
MWRLDLNTSYHQTVLNPTLCLIERMKAVGADIERRKTTAPDRFFSHFYCGPENKSPSVSCFEHSLDFVCVCMTGFAGTATAAGASDAQ